MIVQYDMTELLANDPTKVSFDEFLAKFLVTTLAGANVDSDTYIIRISKMHPALKQKFYEYGHDDNTAIEVDHTNGKGNSDGSGLWVVSK